MTEQRRTSLKQLQKLDMRIQDARQRIQDFEPLLEEVEKPALILGSDLETSRTRLQEMRLEERRLELSVDEKRTREKRLDERLGSVRNLREEAAVSAELEMVRRALQNDEQEALTLLDQIRKMEDRLAEVDEAYTEAREIVQPKKDELLAERTEAEKQLASLLEERERFVGGMPSDELRIYEAIRGGGRGVAVAELTLDGACGHCFGMVPLQIQNEVRHGTTLLRCESCGVILAAPEPGDAAREDEPAGKAGTSGEAEAAGAEAAADDEPDAAGADEQQAVATGPDEPEAAASTGADETTASEAEIAALTGRGEGAGTEPEAAAATEPDAAAASGPGAGTELEAADPAAGDARTEADEPPAPPPPAAAAPRAAREASGAALDDASDEDEGASEDGGEPEEASVVSGSHESEDDGRHGLE